MNPSRTPGMTSARTATPRKVLISDLGSSLLPSSKIIAGSKSRDPRNTGKVDNLRAGLVMGKITSGGKYAPSIIGTLGVTIAGTATQINLLYAAEAAEITRRIGASGTFKLTGPHVAGGRVRTRTITYSSVGAGSGVNEVQTFTPDSSSTAGTYRVLLRKPDGTSVWTATVVWDASDATLQTAITLALGAVAGWVVTSSGTKPWDTSSTLILTASGTGYAAREFPMCEVDNSALTGVTTITAAETTKGVSVAATITITAPGLAAVDCIQTWTPNAAWTAATMSFGFANAANRELEWIVFTYDTNLADTLTHMNALMDARFGAGSIVATGGGNITSVTFTFSGGIYAGREHAQILVDYAGATGAASTTTFTNVPPGGSAGFYAGSFIQPTDGSEEPLGLLTDGYPIKVTDANNANVDVQLTKGLLVGGVVDSSQIINWPTDASMIKWLGGKLNGTDGLRIGRGPFIFDHQY